MTDEIKGDTNTWKIISLPWIGRVHVINISTLTKVICRFNAIIIKLSIAFFTEIGKKVIKFVQTIKKRKILAKDTLGTKNKAGH